MKDWLKRAWPSSAGPIVYGALGVIIGAALISWDGQLHAVWNGLGFAGMGALIGLIGALAGLVTILIGIYQLSQLDQRIERAMDESVRKSQKEIAQHREEQTNQVNELEQQVTDRFNTLKKELTGNFGTMQQDLVRALSLSSMVNFTQDADMAESYAEKALSVFPELPYLRETLGVRFAQSTVIRQWRQLVGPIYQSEVPQFHPDDYRVRAIRWLEEAVRASAQKDAPVPLETPSQIYLHLAQMYTLDGQWGRGESYWQQYLKTRSPDERLEPQEWAALIWHAPSDRAVYDRLQQSGHKPFVYEQSKREIEGRPPWLILGLARPTQTPAPGLFPVVCRISTSTVPERWHFVRLPDEVDANVGLTDQELYGKWVETFSVVVAGWLPLPVQQDSWHEPFGAQEG